VRIVDFSRDAAVPIENFGSERARSVHIADGTGEAHVYSIHFEPGGQIGTHPAGFDQLFLVVAGSGWVEGGDGRREALACGQGAYLSRGESHAKGSDAGMTAVMIQVDSIAAR